MYIIDFNTGSEYQNAVLIESRKLFCKIILKIYCNIFYNRVSIFIVYLQCTIYYRNL